MKRINKKRKTGMLPGELIFTGDSKSTNVDTVATRYNDQVYEIEEPFVLADKKDLVSSDQILWINVNGIHDINVVRKLGRTFSLHPLILEDVLSVGQRPKSEYYENCIFVSIKMFRLSSELEISEEQISIILKENVLISFQEVEGDLFDEIRKNLAKNIGQLRKKGADYLMYRILDVIVDHYFLIIDTFEERIELLEDRIDGNSTNSLEINIREVKKEIIHFKREIRPFNDALLKLLKDDVQLINSETRTYLNDVHDHLTQVLDSLDAQKENLNSLNEQYSTYQAMKLNKIMKVLTVVSTIFIPLTFVAGIYGMNFKNMPELSWENGYFMAWGVMLAIAIIMLVFFRVKKWW
jgi:magnesium transporter